MVLGSQAFIRLCRARDLLRAAHDRPLAIGDVARHAGMSRFHFIRQFGALFGETPHQLRVGARIERAKELLAQGDSPVTDVCLDVGFTSLGSFSDLFARRVGVAPSVYRRQVRTAMPAPGVVPDARIPGCLTLMCGVPADAAIFEKRPARQV